jgi:hypothetical protein
VILPIDVCHCDIQAKHQDANRIVAIKGIPDSEMFSFDETLRREFPQILDVLPTHTTTLGNPAKQPIGRWNVKCATSHFQELANNLSTKLKFLYDDHLKSNGTVLADGAETVTVVSRFKGKPLIDDASSAMTRDSGKESYNSSWTSRLADFYVEADIPKEVLQGLQPNPDPRISAQSPAKKDSYAQVASRRAKTSTVSPSLATPSVPSRLKYPASCCSSNGKWQVWRPVWHHIWMRKRQPATPLSQHLPCSKSPRFPHLLQIFKATNCNPCSHFLLNK